MKPAFAGNVLTRERILDQGFARHENAAGVANYVRQIETGIEGCFFSIHLLPCLDGWIVEVWNWQPEGYFDKQKGTGASIA